METHAENHQLCFNCEAAASGRKLKSAPCVYVADLAVFIMDTLDKFEALNLLTWDNNAIPAGQIWL